MRLPQRAPSRPHGPRRRAPVVPRPVWAGGRPGEGRARPPAAPAPSARARLGWPLGLLAALGCLALAQTWAARSPRFRVGAILVVGAHAVPAEEVAALTGIQGGTPLFRVPRERVEADVERHPWIRSARCQWRLPNVVVLAVEERAPGAVLTLDREYLVSADGRILPPDPARSEGLPALLGVGEGGPASEMRLAAAFRILAGVAEGAPILTADLTGVDVANPDDPWLLLVGGARARLGAPPYEKKVRRLALVLTDLGPEAAGARLDLRFPEEVLVSTSNKGDVSRRAAGRPGSDRT